MPNDSDGVNVLPGHLQPWAGLVRNTWPRSAGTVPDERAVNMALRWVRPGEVSGLAIAMYCRPEGASNAEVLAACHDKKTNRARALHLERKLDFMKASMPDGTLRYFIGPAGSRPGPADAKPFISICSIASAQSLGYLHKLLWAEKDSRYPHSQYYYRRREKL